MTRAVTIRVLVSVLTLAGCGTAAQPGAAPGGGSTTVSPSDDDTSADPQATRSRRSHPSSTPTPSGDAESMTPEQLAAAAVRDLSTRIGVPSEQITVTRNDAVTWRDGALGCPQPGMAYISMLSAGQLIVLDAGGTSYEYHSGRRVAPFLCEDPEPPLPAS